MRKFIDKIFYALGYIPIAEYEKVCFHRRNLQRLVLDYQDGKIKPTPSFQIYQ
jgi:hypothetical protein